ncbi:hypothetical protein TSUD_93690 [Trifolium subterraneum]|uniref:Uncharacterized protein n=1 Tax=Trifolium subterraneum TaxID=3900 RepID=A0A2Z6PAR9_TRISU|nr:hypothetical protein TSUD_93690 [Trifolium subterraneum]
MISDLHLGSTAMTRMGERNTRHDSIYEISHCRVWQQKGMKYSVIYNYTAGAGKEGLQTMGIKTERDTRHDSIYEISHCRVWQQKGMKYSVIYTAGAGKEGLQTMGIMETWSGCFQLIFAIHSPSGQGECSRYPVSLLG